jgi:hypothetical protein
MLKLDLRVDELSQNRALQCNETKNLMAQR